MTPDSSTQAVGVLLPCPFCGAPAKFHHIGNDRTKKRCTEIGCSDRLCGFKKRVCAITHDIAWTERHAFADWNRRATGASAS